MNRKYLWLFVVFAFILAGCAAPMTKTEQGTAVGMGVGAATGAILGQAIGHSTGATVLGAVAGAAVGGIAGNMIGSYMDRQERELQEAMARSEGSRVQRRRDNLELTIKSDVFFDVDSARLKHSGYDEMDRIADILRRYPETNLYVGGHTDSTGSERYNLDLSERRAESVMNAMVDRGINPRRISAKGYGESMPLESNATEAGRQLNRRVVIEIVPIRA
ncbi:MAG: OmpA family protein [Syntrophobacteraceae bacterium]